MGQYLNLVNFLLYHADLNNKPRLLKTNNFIGGSPSYGGSLDIAFPG